MPMVSIVIPVYNEALAIREVLRRVMKAELPPGLSREVIVVDDGSTDDTVNVVREFLEENPEFAETVTFHKAYINSGKGAALRVGFKVARGELILIQDGDLEYNPKNYSDILKEFSDPRVQVVYGSRFLQGWPRGMKALNLIANLVLSFTTRLFYRCRVTDEATGYKAFRTSVVNGIELTGRGFEFCPEFTAKVLSQGISIIEVPIEYNARGILEGKKIKARDGFIALWWLIKVRLLSAFRGGSKKGRARHAIQSS